MIARLALVCPVYAVIHSACFAFAYLLRFEFALTPAEVRGVLAALPLVLGIKLLWLTASRDWRRRHRYTTAADVKTLLIGVAATGAALWVANHLFLLRIPRSVLLLDALLSIVAIGGLRVTLRLWNDIGRPAGGAVRRTLIYGGDSQAVSLLRSLQFSGAEYVVVGMVDPDHQAAAAIVAGKPVVARNRLLESARRLRAQHLLIPSSVPGPVVRELVRELHAEGIQTHVIPAVGEIVEGRYKLSIRDVAIEDLLRRPAAQLNLDQISGYIRGKRVLVTGGAGSIGSELCRQILELGPESLVLLDQSEFGMFAMEQELSARGPSEAQLHYAIGDILDREALWRLVEEHRPHLIFHAAAYKHVPLMEANPREAIRNNVLGTRNVVDAADHCEAEALVLISTDKAVRPTSVMGSTKLVAEKYLQAVAAQSQVRLVTVRFGNVLNSVGSVVPTFRRQIAEGGPVTVTHPDMVRYFMTIPEAVQLVLQAGAIGQSGDLLILDMGEPVKIVDLAKDMIELSGLSCPDDIDIVFTGVRPGEKMYEELFYDFEHGVCKVHEKIFLAPRSNVNLLQVRRDMQRLETAIHDTSPNAAMTLARVVGAYVAADG
ncbi:MAG: polysaccharide biosynthesis protein, partial [Planctomycetes bacterium]|nr:polysaccharide biosynthesis protein [Planctomycetota bacterium]